MLGQLWSTDNIVTKRTHSQTIWALLFPYKLLTFEKPSALFNKQITDNEKCFTHSAKKAKFWFEKPAWMQEK